MSSLDKPFSLYKDVLVNLKTGKPLSQLLPTVLLILKQLQVEEFEKWVLLEMDGYYKWNKALTSEVRVPEYRTRSIL